MSNKDERTLLAANIDVTEFSHEKFLSDAMRERNRVAIFYLETSVLYLARATYVLRHRLRCYTGCPITNATLILTRDSLFN